MKNFIFKFLGLILVFGTHFISVNAQAPQKMSFQAVIRNSAGTLVSSATVGMRISILQGSSSGTPVYVETQTPTTNANGLATLYIGMGTVVSGSMDSINWAMGPYYLKSETDPSGGTTYSVTINQQLVSVPYALYAATAGSTSGAKPTVTTNTVSSIAYTGATAHGTIVSNGGELIMFRGFCVDTALIPTINSAYIASGNTIGAYSNSISGLLPATTYHVRAFASNANGTAYGDTVSFTTSTIAAPIVSTDSIFSITSTAADGSGTVSSDGGSTVTARGICYDTFSMPTIASHISPAGSGMGSFVTTLSSLALTHTYYARAYATNAVGTSYGAQITFTTTLFSRPTITTDSVTAVSYSSAISCVNTTADGGSTITQQGVCYSTSPMPTITGLHINTTTGIGDYPITISGLAPGTTYYVRAFSINSSGTAYGLQDTFTTLSYSTPILTTNTVIGITAVSATSGGNITSTGGTTITASGVCWGHGALPTVDSSHSVDGISTTGLYSSTISGLNPHTTYFARAYATNSAGSGYGSVISFTTDSLYSVPLSLPVVGTDSPLMATSTTAGSGGYVSLDGGSTVTARGVCWGTSTNPTIAGPHTVDGSGLGYYTSTVTGLSGCASVYYVRSYATNSTGTAYGNQYILSTGLLPVLTTNVTSSITATNALSGGVITSDGGCPITARGVCYTVDSAPMMNNFVTINGTGSGAFSSPLSPLASNITYHVRAYATNSVGTTLGAEQIFTTSTPSSLYIGESYAGGVIFYLDSTGLHGMVCTPADLGLRSWGCADYFTYTYISGTDTAFGSGQANTAAIVAGCSDTAGAAYFCNNLTFAGYSDWFLPSYSELNTMFNNLYYIGITVFGHSGYGGYGSFYTTSSQSDLTNNYTIRITDPTIFSECNYDKAGPANVRPVRRF